jgi:hypothetical protein
VVLNSVDAYVYMKDENRRYRYINDKVARDWGVRPEDVVGKLARLLLAIRLGFPGDEVSTAVAMKSLQRVVEYLRSATQEVEAA